ncbi:MAG: ABC transporter substrate-binding protein, partial [Actinomycetota bacterium]
EAVVSCHRNPDSSVRLVALLCLMILSAAACGQKPGVADQPVPLSAQQGQAELGGSTSGSETTTGGGGDFATGGDASTGGGGGFSSGGSTGGSSGSGGASDKGGGGGSGGVGSDPAAPSGGNATGVTTNTIKIGIHAPITGAAPVPSDSAKKGSDVYWKWLESNKQSVFGRRVEVILKNDNYNPSQAVAVCREMVEEDKVFSLSGAAGTDQIQACARYAASAGVPYTSPGVTETGLDNLPTYFATSLTYAGQGPILADMIMKKFGGSSKQAALVYFNTANFYDGRDAFVAAMRERGAEVYQKAVSKTAGASEAQAVVTDLRQRGIDIVFPLTSPVFFLQLLQASRSQNYEPQWTGIGITMTFDAITAVGCRNGTIDGAQFFAPFPAWADTDKFDPDFRKAVQRIYPEEGEGDDFMWLGWTGSTAFHSMLKLIGSNLTRERFIYFVERAGKLSNGISPPASFSPDDHLGGTAVHVSEARCSDARWHTIATNVRGF